MTTALALILAAVTNILAWYAFLVIPAGALLLGALAGSGYGAVSYWTGTKIARRMLWLVLIFQVAAYFLAQFLQYRLVQSLLGYQEGFLAYFDMVTRNFHFKQPAGLEPTPLGIAGYLIRLVELTGFALGALVVPGLLRSVPFCERCQKYRKTIKLTTFDASGDEESSANAQVEALLLSGQNNNATQLVDLVAKQKPRLKEIGVVPQMLQVALITCPGCDEGYLQSERVELEGRQSKTIPLTRTEVGTDFVRSVLAARKEKRI